MTVRSTLPIFPTLTIAAGCAAAARKADLSHRVRLMARPFSLDTVVDRAAALYGDAPLFTSETPCAWHVGRDGSPRSAWSALDIQRVAGTVSRVLRDDLGLQRGDRVAIMKQNHFDLQLLGCGVVRAGGVACPLSDAFAAEKLDPYLRNIGARVLITDPPTLRHLLLESASFGRVQHLVVAGSPDFDLDLAASDVPDDLQCHVLDTMLSDDVMPAVSRAMDEPVYLVHSSGTTGFPKAVVLRNGAQGHAIRGWLGYVHLSRHDRGLAAVPHNHQAVILSFYGLLLSGMRAHFLNGYGREDLDARGLVETLARDRYNGFFAFPIVYTALKEVPLHEYDLGALHFWASTADAMHEVTIRRLVSVGGAFRRHGIPIDGSVYLDAQGSSEVGTPSVLRYYTRFTRRYGRRIGRRGSVPFGPSVRIARDGIRVPRGEVGRLEVRGRTLFGGYWNDDALTYTARRDGWFFTGDVARLCRSGHVVQLDREVDVIRSDRGDLYCLPIEERLHSHPAVMDVCVYGARQPDGSQRPAAAIALREGIAVDEKRLTLELDALLQPDEALAFVHVMPWSQFPIGVTGKTLRRVFRDRTEAAPPAELNRPVAVV